MQRSSITRKLRPARAALGKVAAALRLGRSLVRPSKAFKRSATGFSIRVAAILGVRHHRLRRRAPHKILFKNSSTSRLPANRKLLEPSKLPAPQSRDNEILEKPAVPVQVEIDGAGDGVSAAESGDCVASPTGTTSGEEKTPGIHQLEGVDLRAELFIAKIREQMRRELQRPPP